MDGGGTDGAPAAAVAGATLAKDKITPSATVSDREANGPALTERRARTLEAGIRTCLATGTHSEKPIPLPRIKAPFLQYNPGVRDWTRVPTLVVSAPRQLVFFISEACPPCSEEFHLLAQHWMRLRIAMPVSIIVETSDREIASNLVRGSYAPPAAPAGNAFRYFWDDDERIKRALGVSGSPTLEALAGGRIVRKLIGKGHVDWRETRAVERLFDSEAPDLRTCLERLVADNPPLPYNTASAHAHE